MNAETDVLKEWHERLTTLHRAHKRAAAIYERQSRLLGLSTTVLSAVVGTTIFTTLQETPTIAVRAIVGLISVAAAVVAAVQTFLKLPDLAQRHNSAARQFGDLRRRVERLQATGGHGEDLGQILAKLDDDWFTLSETAPVIEQALHDSVAMSQRATNQQEAGAGSVL